MRRIVVSLLIVLLVFPAFADWATAGQDAAKDLDIGFRGRISADALVVTGSGVPPTALKAEAGQAARTAAILDGLRNLGEVAYSSKELLKKFRNEKLTPEEKIRYGAFRTYEPFFRKIKTTCSVITSRDGKSHHNRCTFDYGKFRIGSSTDVQNYTVTADIITLDAPGMNLKVSDFALAHPAAEDTADRLSALAKKTGLDLTLKTLPDGTSEVNLVRKRTVKAGAKGR